METSALVDTFYWNEITQRYAWVVKNDTGDYTVWEWKQIGQWLYYGHYEPEYFKIAVQPYWTTQLAIHELPEHIQQETWVCLLLRRG